MNLLPIWHTSSNNHQKFKILKKRTDLRINGELITKGDVLSHSSQSYRSSAQTHKNTPTNIIYNHIKEEDGEDDIFDDEDDDDDDYTEYFSLKRDLISNSSNAILDNKHATSRLGSETMYSASSEQFNLIDSNQIKKIRLKNKKNDKKIDVISIPNNYHVEINTKLRKYFFNQNYSDNQNQNIHNNNNNNDRNRTSPKGTKYLKNKNDQNAPTVISHDIATAYNTFSSSSFANSYDSDMFRYQNWIMPDLKASSLTLTKLNNNNNNSR